jgi:hydrogenase maturation protease
MIRVVGIGSPFGDDQAGWRVIELLRDSLAEPVELIALDRPGAALVNWMQGTEHLIVIDALSPQGAPGRVRQIDPDAELVSTGAPSSHALQLADAIRLAGVLGFRPPQLDVYGIEIADVTREGLCEAVAEGARALADSLTDELRRL